MVIITDQAGRRARRARTATAVVDCDVHTYWPTEAVASSYLPPAWRQHKATFGRHGYTGAGYPRRMPYASRRDSYPPNGGAPGSDLAFMRAQHMDAFEVDRIVLTPNGGPDGERNGDYALALSAAVNNWIIDEWLDPCDRLRSSIIVPYEHPDLSVAEIDRLAVDRRFVQVYMQILTNRPIGNRHYWPIYEAAQRNELPVGIHFGGNGGNPRSGAGWPSFYLEDHVGNAQTFQAQVISLVCEGVFERFPDLKIVLIEGGVAWLPPLAWRLDRAFERLSGEVPHLKRRPSEYIAEHIWLTTQPIEEPQDPRDLRRMVESFPSLEDRLLYSSDYPHWDYDSPDEAFRKARFSPEVENKIMHANASSLYGIEIPVA
jgi:uncharacterized protein